MQRKVILQLCYVHLGGMHIGAWRDPEAPPMPAMNFEAIRDTVLTAERAKIHAMFLADSLALYDRSPPSRARLGINAGFEHFTLIAALSTIAKEIGFVVTGNTTYNHPYHLARKYSSLDHLTGGRIGWNAVTSGNPAEAANFGILNEQIPHDERYLIADEFVEVAKGLWDSWDDDAFLCDRDSGLYSKEEGLHVLNHRGRHFSVAGPLTTPRMPQGYPVIFQAGSSSAGREFAAKHAEVLFTMQPQLDAAQAYYREMRDRVESAGRSPDHLKVVANFPAVLGRTKDEALERVSLLDSLVDPIPGLEQLSNYVQHDMAQYPLDEQVPEIPQAKVGSQGVQSYILALAKKDKLTLRQATQLAARQGAEPYSAAEFADRIEEWVTKDACDGINLAFSDIRYSLDVFVEKVVPDLQKRGLFRKSYEGRTLRENLGLPRPASRYQRHR
jgi:FMN-dependent oxidoreductase (nitrilotriacetate monooxygenase family)